MNYSIANIESEFLTIEEVAYKLRVSSKTAYKLAAGGAIRSTRVGRQYRISLEDYDIFLNRPKGPRGI